MVWVDVDGEQVDQVVEQEHWERLEHVLEHWEHFLEHWEHVPEHLEQWEHVPEHWEQVQVQALG